MQRGMRVSSSGAWTCCYDAARGQDEHFACLPQHDGFTRWIPQFSLNLTLPGQQVSLSYCPISFSLSIWLLFVVILLRKIAHILWAQWFRVGSTEICYATALKRGLLLDRQQQCRAVSNELRPNTWRHLKTHIILLPPSLSLAWETTNSTRSC